VKDALEDFRVATKMHGVGAIATEIGSARNLLDYVDSLKADLKLAADMLEEYARHDVTCSCLCCGEPWGTGGDHKADCKIALFVKRVEST
jgi:hypothetical protein